MEEALFVFRRDNYPYQSLLIQSSIYYMSLFKMPKAVIESLDRIRKDFLLEVNGDKKKLHLLKWSEVIKPKCAGGSWSWQFGKQELGVVS